MTKSKEKEDVCANCGRPLDPYHRIEVEEIGVPRSEWKKACDFPCGFAIRNKNNKNNVHK